MRTPSRPRAHCADPISRRPGIALALAALPVVVLGACGDDESAQDRYCAAGDDLRSSVAALGSVDLISEGTSGLEDALDEVRSDLGDLSDAASDAVSDDVDALDDAVSALQSALSDLGGDISPDNASAVGTAVQGVVTAAGTVFETLGDC